MVGGLSHALAETQVLTEFLDGLRLIDIDAQDGKNSLDRAVGGFLAGFVGAVAV